MLPKLPRKLLPHNLFLQQLFSHQLIPRQLIPRQLMVYLKNQDRHRALLDVEPMAPKLQHAIAPTELALTLSYIGNQSCV